MPLFATHDRSFLLKSLRSIPVNRPPCAGAYWKGTPHADLVEAIFDRLEQKHWQISQPVRVATAREGADLVLTVGVGTKTVITGFKGTNLFGIRASNSRRSSLCFYGGVQDSDNCRYILFTIPGMQKKTLNFDLEAEVRHAVAVWDQSITAAVLESHGVRSLACSWSDVLMQAYDNKIISARIMGRMADELTTADLPRYWDVLKVYSKVTNHEGPTFELLDRLYKFYRLLRKDIRRS